MRSASQETLTAWMLLVAVVLGLGLMELMFLREHKETIERIQTNVALRNRYARRVLAEVLSKELAARQDRMEAALRDPMVPTMDLYLRRADSVLLPRSWAPNPVGGLTQQWQRAVLEGEDAPSNDDGPSDARLELAREVRRSIALADRSGIERAVRAYLAHRARFLIPAEVDLALTLVVLRELHRGSAPDPGLVRTLLTDGLRDPGGASPGGLMPQLLRRRDRFSVEESTELASQILALAEGYGVSTTNFESARAETPVSPPTIAGELRDPSVDPSFEWYFEPRSGEVHGVRVDKIALFSRVHDELVARAIVSETDQILPLGSLSAEASGLVSVTSLSLSVSAPLLDAEVPAAHRRLWTKTALVGGTGLLFALVLALGFAWQKRERALVELKADFVATVSHELRTPLASVRLLAETLDRRLGGDERAKDYPSRIVREIDGAGFLVENILSFNRVDKGRWVLYPERVDLLELFRQLGSELSRQLGCEVHVVSGGGPIVLSMDPELARLLVANLTKNAILYNERAPVRIEVEARADETRTVVTVRDNGVGIDPTEHEQIFGDFQRGTQGGKTRRPGSGLGLGLVRRIMRLHGGEARLGSSDASGSCFELEFRRGGQDLA